MEIPNDIVRYVFAYLSIKDLKNSRILCKRILREIDTHLVVLAMSITSDRQPETSLPIQTAIEIITKSMKETTRNKISKVEFYYSEAEFSKHKIVLELLPNVHSLRMIGKLRRYNNSVENIDNFLKGLPASIKRLEIIDENVPSLQNIPLQISHLQFSNGTFQNPNLTAHTSLTKISLNGEFNPSILTQLPTSLKSITIWMNKQIKSLRGLEKLEKLKTVDLTSVGITNEDEFKFLPKTIRRLTIQQLNFSVPPSFQFIPSQLYQLSISGNFDLDSKLPSTLKKLSIFGCKISLIGFNFPPGLLYLNIDGIRVDGPLTFEKLPNTMQRIRINEVNCDGSVLLTLPKSVSMIKIRNRETKLVELQKVIREFKAAKRHLTIMATYYDKKWINTELRTWMDA